MTRKDPACAPGACGVRAPYSELNPADRAVQWYSDVNFILLGVILMEQQASSSIRPAIKRACTDEWFSREPHTGSN